MLYDKKLTFHVVKETPSVENNSDGPILTLMLTGFKEIREETIKYFLESKKVSNGGEITSFSYNKNDQSAIVTFSREERRHSL